MVQRYILHLVNVLAHKKTTTAKSFVKYTGKGLHRIGSSGQMGDEGALGRWHHAKGCLMPVLGIETGILGKASPAKSICPSPLTSLTELQHRTEGVQQAAIPCR